jgi:O-antigen ligase
LGLLALAAVQLVPLGASALARLSPWSAALRASLGDPAHLPTTLSIAPDATASALRTGAATVGLLFVATTVVARRGSARLGTAMLVSAAFQGLYGVLVLASGHDRIWDVPKTAYLDSATGTFVNRNHFAGFLAATLPVGFGLVVGALRDARRRPGARGLAAMLGNDGSRSLLLGLLALLGLSGVLLSYSRAGTALALVAVATTVASVSGGAALRRAAIVLAIVAVAAVPLADIGFERLVDRYADAATDVAAGGGRLEVWRDTLTLIRHAPILGCGFGAFTWAFPAASSAGVRLHYTHAHNDLLQLLAEGGAAAAALVLLIALPVARRAGTIVVSGRDPVAAGAAFGLAALALHGLVDFNFHIPANLAIAGILAGVVLGASWTDES